MKRIIYILGIIACAIVCVSCDTRDDWFKENCEEVYFYFVFPDGRTDTVDVKKPHMLEYTIRVDSVARKAYLETIGYQIYCEALGEKRRVRPYSIHPIDNPYSLSVKIGEFSIAGSYMFNRDDYTTFGGSGEITNYHLFDSDTSAKQIGNAIFLEGVRDVFDNEYWIKIKINVIGNFPPIPIIEVTGEGMERTISLKESYDKDGSVSKYEICIDGNIVEYSKYDNRYEKYGIPSWEGDNLIVPEQYWQGGKAAYGGVYITSTSINEFNHVFQELGKHTIYYRCMDNEGAWSTWKKEIIELNK